ncbi:MAG: COX15/CtaA family protein [Bacteroidota bacterium]
MNNSATGWFGKFCLTALVAVFLLVFVGGIVRSTGSGMGCPDWPKCFGSLIPPTSVDQLPTDYKEHYAAYRERKNQRFAAFLSFIGMEQTGKAILEDPTVLQEADFNATKTWIEYVNRLLGAVVGLILTVLFIFSFKRARKITFLVGMSWALVVFTGWFGSIVVSSNLTPWTVTVHLALAFAILGLLTAAHHYSSGANSNVPPSLPAYTLLALIAQIFFGTRVRGEVDRIASINPDRGVWIENAGQHFILHRSFSWVVLIGVGAVIWLLTKRSYSRVFTFSLVGIVLGLISTGAIMSYFGIPWMIQPFHLLLSTIAFCMLLKLSLNPSEQIIP